MHADRLCYHKLKSKQKTNSIQEETFETFFVFFLLKNNNYVKQDQLSILKLK